MLRRDETRSEQFIDDLPDGDAKNIGIYLTVLTTAESDPEAAYDMINQLNTERHLKAATWYIAEQWATREPHRLSEISRLLNLTPEQAARLERDYIGG